MKHGKKYLESAKLIESSKLYDPDEAVKLALQTAKTKFDETMEISVRLGVDPRQADQQVRGAVVLPHGTGKKVRVLVFAKGEQAKAAEEVVKAQNLQSENDYRRKIFTAVGQFNNQRQQCMASRKAMEIASERYELMMDKFRRGSATVTDLTNAQNDNESAMAKYITDYSNFWTYYYTLRKYALYDFITGKDIDVNVKEMVE